MQFYAGWLADFQGAMDSESVLSAPTRTIAFPVKILLLFLEIEFCLYKSERKWSRDCAVKNQKANMFHALKKMLDKCKERLHPFQSTSFEFAARNAIF